MPGMNSRLLLTILLILLLAPAAADAGPWSPGTYRGKLTNASYSGDRGRVAFTVTRTRARVDRLVAEVNCPDGERRRFDIGGGRSGRLNPGPVGAGVSIRGSRTIDGWDVDWDLVGGVKGSRFRGTAGVTAERDGDICELFGGFSARRRG